MSIAAFPFMAFVICVSPVEAEKSKVSNAIQECLARIQARLQESREQCKQLSNISSLQIWTKAKRHGLDYQKGVLGKPGPFQRTPLEKYGAIISMCIEFPYKSEYPEQSIPDLEINFQDGTKLLVSTHAETETSSGEDEFNQLVYTIIESELKFSAEKCNTFGIQNIRFGPTRLTHRSTRTLPLRVNVRPVAPLSAAPVNSIR